MPPRLPELSHENAAFIVMHPHPPAPHSRTREESEALYRDRLEQALAQHLQRNNGHAAQLGPLVRAQPSVHSRGMHWPVMGTSDMLASLHQHLRNSREGSLVRMGEEIFAGDEFHPGYQAEFEEQMRQLMTREMPQPPHATGKEAA